MRTRKDRKVSSGRPSSKSRILTGRAPVVLIVDDRADQREMYAMYLAARGCRVAMAGDGVTAIRVAEAVQPDVIVMDLSLPRLDGWEATRRLKQKSKTAHIPILACTAHLIGGSAEQAIVAGCDAYVIKPCLPEDLLQQIRTLLGRYAGLRDRRPA